MLVAPPRDLARHPRVVIHGVTGSGKSTLAARLADLTGAPRVSVDDLMWRPGWVQLTAEEQIAAILPWAEEPAWVMDSLWSATRPVVLPRTDLLVALDFPRRVSLLRLVRRTWRRLHTRERICGGNTESWRALFSRDSIIAWHFRSFPAKRVTIAAWAADAGGPPMVRLTSPGQVDAWLRTLEAAAA